MIGRCISSGWIGKILGLALIAAVLSPAASTRSWADNFRGGHFVGHPFFHGPFVHGPFFHGPFFVHGPRVFVGVGPFVGPVYPYPYAYPYPYPYYPYPYPYYAPPRAYP